RQTREALKTLTNAAVEDLLGRQVQLTDQHREFFKKVLSQHAAFAAAKANDADGRESQVEGSMQVAKILLLLGEYKEAESAYDEFVAQSEQLVADFSARTEFRRYLAASYHDRAS